MLGFQEFSHRWLRRPYRLHVAIDDGDSAQTAVLLHGLASSGRVWHQLSNNLVTKDFRVLAYDLLGFGDSEKPAWPSYSVEDHARNVLHSLRTSGVQFPVTIIGHSMGCLIAVHLASQHPRLIKRVILYEPPLFADIPEFSSHARRRKLYFSLFERIAGNPTMMLTYARLLGRAATKIAGFALSEETWVPFERSLRNTIMGQAAYHELHALEVPTDIVYGRFDIVVTQTEVKRMFADNEHITFHNVSDIHGISKKSSLYLSRLIAGQNTASKRRRVASARQNRDNKRTQKGGA